jgi:hypothetical protein
MHDYICKATPKKPELELDADAWSSPNHPAAVDIPRPSAHLQHAWRARANKAQDRRDNLSKDRNYNYMNPSLLLPVKVLFQEALCHSVLLESQKSLLSLRPYFMKLGFTGTMILHSSVCDGIP